jgi:exonuclease VII large subunit
VQDDSGGIVRSAMNLKSGDRVTARVAQGRLEAKVTSVQPE